MLYTINDNVLYYTAQPKVNEEEDQIVLSFNLAGVAKDDILVEVDDDTLKVNAEDGAKMYSYYLGKYKDAVGDVTYTDGMLRVYIDKTKNVRTLTIK